MGRASKIPQANAGSVAAPRSPLDAWLRQADEALETRAAQTRVAAVAEHPGPDAKAAPPEFEGRTARRTFLDAEVGPDEASQNGRAHPRNSPQGNVGPAQGNVSRPVESALVDRMREEEERLAAREASATGQGPRRLETLARTRVEPPPPPADEEFPGASWISQHTLDRAANEHILKAKTDVDGTTLFVILPHGDRKECKDNFFCSLCEKHLNAGTLEAHMDSNGHKNKIHWVQQNGGVLDRGGYTVPPEWWLAWVPVSEENPDGAREMKCLLCDKWATDRPAHSADMEKSSKDHKRHFLNYDPTDDYWYQKVEVKRRQWHPDLAASGAPACGPRRTVAPQDRWPHDLAPQATPSAASNALPLPAPAAARDQEVPATMSWLGAPTRSIADSQDRASSGDSQSPAVAASRAPAQSSEDRDRDLPPGWKSAFSTDGRPYYYLVGTSRTTWTKPRASS